MIMRKRARLLMVALVVMTVPMLVSSLYGYYAGYNRAKAFYLEKMQWHENQTEYWQHEAWRVYYSSNLYR